MNELSRNQGCNFEFNKHAIEIKKNFVITSDGSTYTSDYVALCTNGEGYYKKFGLEPLVVKSAILEGYSAGLPEMFTDMTKEYSGFYGQRTGDNELLNQYIIGMTDYKTEEQIQDFLDHRIPGARIQEIHKYIDIRKDNKLVTICEQD